MNTIIKPSYLFIGATLMISACAQEDISRDDEGGGGERIIFHTAIPGVSGRAAEIVSDFDYFNITAFNPADQDKRAEDGSLSAYIDNVKIVKEEGQNTVSSADCLWPEPKKEGTVSFFAYYPDLNEGAELVNASNVSGSEPIIDYKIKDFRVADDIADQVDFVTAYATGSKTDNLFSGITLDFEHRLSRVEVKAWGVNKSFDIEIAGVRIGGVGVKGTLDLNPLNGESAWSDVDKGVVEYIYRNGDKIVSLPLQNSLHATSDKAVSIMGADLDNELNCAMLIPSNNTGWLYKENPHNSETDGSPAGMYISVLLRVIDVKHDGKQQYPDTDNSPGENVANIPIVYLAVDADTDTVTRRVYKKNTGYFLDEAGEEQYIAVENEIVKEFGWAALPITGEWTPGKIYTFTLDYSYGVGLHDPEDPNAGESIFSDKVLVNVSVSNWVKGADNGFEVPRN